MKKDIEDLKKELVVEIKALAADVASSNSYVGLLANEIKFRSLQEKFINLKFLERKRYGLEIFDSNIPEEAGIELDDFKEERESIVWDSDTAEQMELKSDAPTQQSVEVEEIEVESDFAEALEDEIVENAFQEEDSEDTIIEISAEEEIILTSEEPSNELLEEDSQEESETLENIIDDEDLNESGAIEEEIYDSINAADHYDDLVKEEKRLLPLQLDFNDQLAFQYQLFDGDNESMDMVVRTLNAIHSLEDSKKYLADLQREMQWEDKEEYVERLKELVIKRFE